MKASIVALSFLFLSAAQAASPEIKKSSCTVEMKEFDTSKNKPIPTKDSNHTFESYQITWAKNGNTFSLENRVVKSTRFANWDFTQTLAQAASNSSPAQRIEDVETKYFYDSSGVKVIEKQRRLETQDSDSGQVVTDITFTDSSRNSAKLYITQVSKPDGSVERVSERREPSPAGADGVQVLSRKTTCREETISSEKLKFDKHVRKFKTKIDGLSKAMDEKSDSELLTAWRSLFKSSDFRSDGNNSGGDGTDTGGSSSCERLKPLFNRCIYHRANCWEYNPGGACYGVPNMWGQCTGTRPPMLGCSGM